jgi:CheY-like chemotaxis protein
MAHGVAAQSGGTLTIRSRKGHGTAVDLWLPAAAAVEPAHPAPAPAPAPAQGPPERLRILAVDDDVLVLTNTVAMLEDLGHQVIPADSALTALELLRDAPQVDLVITDQAMPQMTGQQLCEVIRRTWPKIPVLLATGYAELADDAAADMPRLAKPFNQAQLELAVAESARPAAVSAPPSP